MTNAYSIIVGSFHTEWLADETIQKLLPIIQNTKTNIIFLLQDNGIVNQKWPLPFQERSEMLREVFEPNTITIGPLPDCELDEDWTAAIEQRLDLLLPENNRCTLYFSEASAACYHPKKYKVVESLKKFNSNLCPPYVRTFGDITDISIAYRKGIRESYLRSYGCVYPTVDIALTKIDNMRRMILVGKKKNESFYRLPGGFVDKKDETRQLAARRELYEETNLTVEGNLISLGDFKIDDWRYKNTTDSILTTLFLGEYSFGILKAGDDLVKEVAWIPLDTADAVIGKAHKPLISKVKEYYDIKN